MIKDIAQHLCKIVGFIVGSIVFTTVYLVLIVFFFTFNPLKVYANEISTTKPSEVADVFIFGDGDATTYKYTMDFGENPNSAGYYNKLLINSTVPVVFYYNENGNMCMMMTVDGKERDLSYWTDINGTNLGSAAGTDALAQYGAKEFTWGSSYLESLFVSCSENCMIFESETYARNYIDTGDTSGWVNKPGIDWTIPHDFSRDKYSADIPIPQVSNLGLTGFTLLNRGDYYYDVIVESRLYGVKVGWVKSPNGLGVHRQTAVDKDWVYATNYYNFELDDKAHNATHCSIVREYGVSLTDDLVDDYKNWSADYPNPQSLPSYEWYIANSLDALYKAGHTCNAELGDDLGLIESGQSEVTYYIRYMDTHGNYGQWVRYKWSPNVTNDGGTLVAGSVEVSPDGNVIVNDVLSGTTDEHGTASYTPPHVTEPGDNDATISEGITQLTSILSNMQSFLGGVPDLVSYVFPFMPWWLTALIFGGIGCTVLVAIIRILRG